MKWICSFLPALIVALSACRQDKGTDVKFDQYYVRGKSLYKTHCSNCHQENGSGLGRLYPPLDSTDFIRGNVDEVICIIRFGKSGEMTINGKSFDQPMPANPRLTDLEVAEIATYILNSWENREGMVPVQSVSRISEKCGSRE